jgi:hypothetical protein
LDRIVDFRHRGMSSRRVAQVIDAHQAAEQTAYGISRICQFAVEHRGGGGGDAAGESAEAQVGGVRELIAGSAQVKLVQGELQLWQGIVARSVQVLAQHLVEALATDRNAKRESRDLRRACDDVVERRADHRREIVLTLVGPEYLTKRLVLLQVGQCIRSDAADGPDPGGLKEQQESTEGIDQRRIETESEQLLHLIDGPYKAVRRGPLPLAFLGERRQRDARRRQRTGILGKSTPAVPDRSCNLRLACSPGQ